MKTNTVNEEVVIEPAVESAESTAPTKAPVAPTKHVPSIGEVIESIRGDSQTNPRRYLNEVHVPGGGE